MDAYLFAWNPRGQNPKSLVRQIRQIEKNGFVTIRWRAGARRNLPVGSRAFLIRLGEQPKGIVGAGWTREKPRGLPASLALRVDTLSDIPLIPFELLQKPPFDSFHWSIQGSGVRLPATIAVHLESAWAVRLDHRESVAEIRRNERVTHILVGTNEDDYDTLIEVAAGSSPTPWIVPKHSQPGDPVLFYISSAGIVAAGHVHSAPQPATFGARRAYTAEISGLGLLATPVPGAFLHQVLPDWGWPTYPRSYTSLTPSFATRLNAILETYQADLARDLVEGQPMRALITSFERNPHARAACIRYHGSACTVCGFAFAAEFGPEFDGFIHVHHLRPLSTIREEYVVNPVRDLRPLCPNCHAVAHRRHPPFSLSELKALVRSAARAGA